MYFLGVLAAFISPASYSLSNIFDAYVTGHLFKKIATTIFYSNLTAVMGLMVLYLLGPIHLLSMDLLPYALLIAFIHVGYLFPYYLALKSVDTSIVAAMFSLDKIFIPVWAYLIVGECLSFSQYFGITLVIVFSLILNIEKPQKIKINRGFWLMLLVAFMLSFEGTFYKRLLIETDWISAAFWCSLFSFMGRLCLFFIKPMRQDIIENFSVYKRNFHRFCLIEVFDQLGYLGPIFALSLIPVLVEAGISSTQPIFVAFYGVIFTKIFGPLFKENLTKKNMIKKMICFIFIGVGVHLVIG